MSAGSMDMEWNINKGDIFEKGSTRYKVTNLDKSNDQITLESQEDDSTHTVTYSTLNSDFSRISASAS